MVRIEATKSGSGCTLVDDIQGVRFEVGTAGIVHPEQYAVENIGAPLDSGYRLDTAEICLPKPVAVFVREPDGQPIEELSERGEFTYPDGEYMLELGGLAIKTYLRVSGRVSIQIDTDENDETRIHAMDADHIALGLRSFHEVPATTVTTTDEPRDIMRAVSCLGSGLKATSCERSFPTLRGHPPKIEMGECFDAPQDVERTPENASVTIEVPEELSSIYPVAPLAYYLNAVVVPGTEPRLIADGVSHSLDGEGGLEATVGRILKHVFTLDCIIRTEGWYPIELGERDAFSERVDTDSDLDLDLDYSDLYQRSLVEQVNTYLSIPFETLDGIRPRWPLTVDIVPELEHFPHVPYVVYDLCTLRCPNPSPSDEATADPIEEKAINDFYRGPDSASISRGRDIHRDPDENGNDDSDNDDTDSRFSDIPRVFKPELTDSVTHMWIGEGYPVLSAKPTLEASQRRLEAIPSGSIEVAVVSNSSEMREESDVADMYGLRELVDFEVEIYEDLTQDELRAVLADDYDLLHYVGHVTASGIQCEDGWLDAETLDQDHVNVRAFILNGCRSFEQGMELVHAGAIGGLCTLSNIGNSPATSIGRTVARLLNVGFSLGGVLDIIKDELLTARRYMIVGDPRLAIAESQGSTPILAELSRIDSSTFSISINGYITDKALIGGIFTPIVPEDEPYFLQGGSTSSFSIGYDNLKTYLGYEQFPVRVSDSLTWSEELFSGNSLNI
jgi:hypothetical protein